MGGSAVCVQHSVHGHLVILDGAQEIFVDKIPARFPVVKRSNGDVLASVAKRKYVWTFDECGYFAFG